MCKVQDMALLRRPVVRATMEPAGRALGSALAELPPWSVPYSCPHQQKR